MSVTNTALLAFFLAVATALTLQEAQGASSSYINYHALENIEVGSSLTADGASSWLSTSGRFAFGFYPEADGFFVGIQLIVSPSNSNVVWTARPDLKPFPRGALLNFTRKGIFVTSNKGAPPLLLVNFSSSATSAAMLNNGNFVVYRSNSSDISQNSNVNFASSVPGSRSGASYNNFKWKQSRVCSKIYSCRSSDSYSNSTDRNSDDDSSIMWRSFDYPTDTILGSQVLPCGYNLASSASQNNHSIGMYILRMQCDGNLVCYPAYSDIATWASGTSGDNYINLALNENGRLYLSSNDSIQKDLSGYKPPNVQSEMLYRATLDPDKIFRLHAINIVTNETTVVNEFPYYKDKCQAKDICGVNSYCLVANDNPNCHCMPGFENIYRGVPGGGCQMSKATPSCRVRSAADQPFMEQVENIVGLDDLSYNITSTASRETCSSLCLIDCDCFAAVFLEQKCSKLKLPLASGRVDANVPSVAFVKVVSVVNGSGAANGHRNREFRVMAVVICAAVAAALCLAVIAGSIGAYCLLFGRFRKRWQEWEMALTDEIAPRYFSYEELMKCLGPSGQELGQGGHGLVFRLELPINGKTVAVAMKKLHGAEGERKREFQAEMRLIGRAHHVNLVRLLGFCHDDLSQLLVYEFMSRGSLANHIFEIPTKRPSWQRRIALLLGAARGIHYLHRECERKIIHRDIKPENILIAEDWTAKIADFGLAKLVMATQTRAATRTVAAGTEGYIAPECERAEDDGTGNVQVTEKADVYSYGVVVLETMCSKRNRDAKLCDLVRARHGSNELGRLLDGEQVEASELERVVKVGILCVQEDPEKRPFMEDVVMMLEGDMDVPNPPPLP